jgi:hypothetical protein
MEAAISPRSTPASKRDAAEVRDKVSSRSVRTTSARACPLAAAVVCVDTECDCQLLGDILKTQLLRARPCDHHEVGGRLQLVSMQSEKLSNSPLHPVALHRITYSPADRYAQASVRGLGRGAQKDEVRRLSPAGSLLDAHILRALPDPEPSRETLVFPIGVPAWQALRRQDACAPWRGDA